MLCLWVQMRGSCDPGGVPDGSRLAVYQTLPLYQVPLVVLHACFALVFAIDISVDIDIDIAMHPTYLSWHLLLWYCSFCFVFSLFFLSFLPYFCFLFCFFNAVVGALDYRYSSDLFLSSRPRTTIGLAIILY